MLFIIVFYEILINRLFTLFIIVFNEIQNSSTFLSIQFVVLYPKISCTSQTSNEFENIRTRPRVPKQRIIQETFLEDISQSPSKKTFFKNSLANNGPRRFKTKQVKGRVYLGIPRRLIHLRVAFRSIAGRGWKLKFSTTFVDVPGRATSATMVPRSCHSQWNFYRRRLRRRIRKHFS